MFHLLEAQISTFEDATQSEEPAFPKVWALWLLTRVLWKEGSCGKSLGSQNFWKAFMPRAFHVNVLCECSGDGSVEYRLFCSIFKCGIFPFLLSVLQEECSTELILRTTTNVTGLPWWLIGKEPTCQCRRLGFNPWVRKIPWRRKQQPMQYSCLGNSMDKGAWWATVHGVTKSWTWPNN